MTLTSKFALCFHSILSRSLPLPELRSLCQKLQRNYVSMYAAPLWEALCGF